MLSLKDKKDRGNVMDKELLEAGYRAYTGEKIDVYFNTAICQHSGTACAAARSFQPEA
jgi:hypothetical protein